MTAQLAYDDVLDSLFHGCALHAFLDQAAEEGRFPPDSEATRRRAYRYYEEELAKKNALRQPSDSANIPAQTVTPGRRPRRRRT
jgi:hypothetical protein